MIEIEEKTLIGGIVIIGVIGVVSYQTFKWVNTMASNALFGGIGNLFKKKKNS